MLNLTCLQRLTNGSICDLEDPTDEDLLDWINSEYPDWETCVENATQKPTKTPLPTPPTQWQGGTLILEDSNLCNIQIVDNLLIFPEHKDNIYISKQDDILHTTITFDSWETYNDEYIYFEGEGYKLRFNRNEAYTLTCVPNNPTGCIKFSGSSGDEFELESMSFTCMGKFKYKIQITGLISGVKKDDILEFRTHYNHIISTINIITNRECVISLPAGAVLFVSDTNDDHKEYSGYIEYSISISNKHVCIRYELGCIPVLTGFHFNTLFI